MGRLLNENNYPLETREAAFYWIEDNIKNNYLYGESFVSYRDLIVHAIRMVTVASSDDDDYEPEYSDDDWLDESSEDSSSSASLWSSFKDGGAWMLSSGMKALSTGAKLVKEHPAESVLATVAGLTAAYYDPIAYFDSAAEVIPELIGSSIVSGLIGSVGGFMGGKAVTSARNTRVEEAALNEQYKAALREAEDYIYRWMAGFKAPIEGEKLEFALARTLRYVNRSIIKQTGRRLEAEVIDGHYPGILLSINPTLFMPLNTTVLSGLRAGKIPATGDYLRSTQHDGPYKTPLKEVMDQWNSASDVKGKDKIATKDIDFKHIYPTKTYIRPGTVEAQTSVPRGSGRSGTGETAIGHLGNHVELIMTGNTSTRFNGGHLIGDQLLDAHDTFELYEDWNLAPQHRKFNSPLYSGLMESPMTTGISASTPVKMTVDVRYASDERTIDAAVALSNILTPTANSRINKTKGPSDLDFHSRIPQHWYANAEILGGGSVRFSAPKKKSSVRMRGSAIGESDSLTLSSGEDFAYSLAYTKGGTKVMFDPADQRTKATKASDRVSGVTDVSISARQKIF